MKLGSISQAFLCVFAPCVSISVSSAQSPVPARVAVEHYGVASGTANTTTLRIEMDARNAEQSTLRVRGGTPGNIAGILIGSSPASLPLPFGMTLLVAPNATPVFGVFDKNGRFALPIDLGDPQRVGQTLYCQGFQFQPPKDPKIGIIVFHLSQGMKVGFAKGNAQPNLTYNGPAFTAILMRETLGKDSAPSFAVLSRVLVPTAGYQLRHHGTQSTGGVTRIYLTLQPTNQPQLQVVVSKRRFVTLAPRPASKIEVWLNTSPWLPAYARARAAVIQRDF